MTSEQRRDLLRAAGLLVAAAQDVSNAAKALDRAGEEPSGKIVNGLAVKLRHNADQIRAWLSAQDRARG